MLITVIGKMCTVGCASSCQKETVAGVTTLILACRSALIAHNNAASDVFCFVIQVHKPFLSTFLTSIPS